VTALAALSGGCSGPSSEKVTVRPSGAPTSVRPDLLPPQFAGLNVTPEDVSALEKKVAKTSYVSSTRLWGLRAGDRLKATLQVSTFVPDSDPTNEKFQRTIVALIAESSWRPRMLEGTRVYVTAANQQPEYIWFRDSSLFVLAVAVDHPAPRSILRQALELRP
jgi:hypothetical protein